MSEKDIWRDVVVATPDPPSKGVHNPIHDADGADAAGYAGALVAGVRTYGWAARTIERALGSAWVQSGWVDFSLLRPLYAGESLQAEIRQENDVYTLKCIVGDDQRVVLSGSAGLGPAPWLAELTPPEPAVAVESLAQPLPGYGLDDIPLHKPLAPLGVRVSAEAARSMVVNDLRLDSPAYTELPKPLIHPYFLAGRIAPLTRHNFTYGPTIHVRSQIQHLAAAESDSQIVVGAQIVDAFERNEHWYQVLDGIISQGDGVSTPFTTVAKIRHHTIFSPRGTR